MKCPECDHNQLRGKSGMRCTSCGYQFIFDPKRHTCGSKPLTDAYFIKCIDNISRGDTYFYTEDELYCYMAKKAKVSFFGCLALSLFVTVFTTMVLSAIFGGFTLWPAITLLPTLIFFSIRSFRKPLSKKRWAKHLKHWRKQTVKHKRKGNPLAGLLTTPKLTEKPAQQSEPDIYNYGASKLLICEHDIQVDWLVMNKFHSQNGVVVISENGYPHYLSDHVKQLIASNPELEIYLLHNSGATGEAMPNRVRAQWNITQHTFIDLGINPELLRQSRLKNSLVEQYYGNFPAHALHYHFFNRLLTHSVSTGVVLGVSMAMFSADSDTGISCDFG